MVHPGALLCDQNEAIRCTFAPHSRGRLHGSSTGDVQQLRLPCDRHGCKAIKCRALALAHCSVWVALQPPSPGCTIGCCSMLHSIASVVLHLTVPAGALGLRLGATSKELVAALLPLTTHQRYRVRVAAIEAIRDVVHQVGSWGYWGKQLGFCLLCSMELCNTVTGGVAVQTAPCT